jgi:Uma2 family endonuclease
MTITTQAQLTLEEYLNYDGGTDAGYELVDGVLVEIGAEYPINSTIISFLFAVFLGMGMPHYRLAIGHQIAVSSMKATARQPDLVVHSEASATAILSGSRLLMPEMPVPLLVVEVVSSSDTDPKSRDRDYKEKRAEYAVRQIPEYWIIDPIAAVVWVLTLAGEEYRESGFTGTQKIVSPGFPGLNLMAEQVLKAGR